MKTIIVNISTLKGLKRAEWYQARGYKFNHISFDVLEFFKD